MKKSEPGIRTVEDAEDAKEDERTKWLVGEFERFGGCESHGS